MVVLVFIVRAVEALSQIVFVASELITGVGSTVTITLMGVPEHNNELVAVPVHGVIFYVTVWAVCPLLSNVWAIRVPSGVPSAGPLVAPNIFAPTELTVHL